MTSVVVVGGGGREHALAHVLGRSADVVVTPGNPGIPGSVGTPPSELDADLFVIGPEAPLVDGLADALRAQEAAQRAGFGVNLLADYCRTADLTGLVVGFGGVTDDELDRALAALTSVL